MLSKQCWESGGEKGPAIKFDRLANNKSWFLSDAFKAHNAKTAKLIASILSATPKTKLFHDKSVFNAKFKKARKNEHICLVSRKEDKADLGLDKDMTNVMTIQAFMHKFKKVSVVHFGGSMKKKATTKPVVPMLAAV